MVNRLIVGVVRLAGINKNDTSGRGEFVTLPPVTEFDVTIMVFGINGSIPDNDVSLIINRDQQFVGVLESIEGFEDAEVFDVFDYNRRDALEVDDEEEDESGEEIMEDTEEPMDTTDDFDKGKDKEIERGNRQPGKLTSSKTCNFSLQALFTGDKFLYDCYQTTNNDSKMPTNNSLIFYYIDTTYITYVQFTIFDVSNQAHYL